MPIRSATEKCGAIQERTEAKSMKSITIRKTDRSIVLKPILAFIAGYFLFAPMACTTVADNVVLTSEERQLKSKISEIDLLLLDIRFKPDPLLFEKAQTLVKEQLSVKILDKTLDAELYGLLGFLDYLEGKTENLRQNLESIESRSKKEARLYIIRALTENDRKKKQEILESGVTTAGKPGLVKLELAGLLYANGEYAKAGALYDDAFSELDPKYKEYYIKDRDKAYRLMSNRSDKADIRTIFEKDLLLVSDVFRITLVESNLLDNVTSNKLMDPDGLLSLLKTNGSVYPTSLKSQDVMARKDIAYFILSIVVYLENNQALAKKQSYEYSRQNLESPVKDVRVSDYFFDAVIVLVEREIFDLPDGINFYPDRPMSGSEYNEILLKLKKRYNY
jgi:hypothetical protein